MSDHPWTIEKIAALPEGPAWGERIYETDDGRKITVPAVPDTIAIFAKEDDVLSFIDADGVGWMLGRYVDGRYFKRRVVGGFT